MQRKPLYLAWAGLFIVCAGLSFIPEPTGILQVGMEVLSVLFFLPPAALLYLGRKTGDPFPGQLIRLLSALSLGLTVVLLVGNVLSVFSSPLVGAALHILLAVVSCPMICSGHWAMSLFFWACLLMVSVQKLPGKRK